MNKPRASTLFSSNLKAIRCKCGLSQREVAQRLKVSMSTVSGWEIGKQPGFDCLDKLAELFGTPVSYFYNCGMGARDIETKVPLHSVDAFVDAVLSADNVELRIMSKASDGVVFKVIQCSDFC